MSAEIFAKSINHNPKLGPDLEMVSETMVSETAQWNRNSILPGVPSGTLTRTCLSTNEKFGAVWLLKRSKTINYPSRIETFQNGNGHKLVAAQDLPAGTVVEKFEGTF
jgi:hypothetical protein